VALLVSLVTGETAYAVEARVAASLEPSGQVWVGERITLRVDLKTDGLSFRGQRIPLPDVPGALLLEDSVTTVKLSEQVDGETWQVLRYEYPMYLQRSGEARIPSIEIAFSATEGFGTEPRSFRLSTAPLTISARVPGGVKNVRQLVTSSNFTVRSQFDPKPGTSGQLHVGDALTRKIVRSAADLTGMAFAPVVTSDLEGIAVYDRSPEIEESHNRGQMTGTRTDTTVYVLQEPGSFVLPGFEFEWWNPETHRLETKTIPSLEIEVAPNVFLESGGPEASEVLEATSSMFRRHPEFFLLGMLAFSAMVWAVRKWSPLAVRAFRDRRAAARVAEPARFRKLLRACRSNDPVFVYNALTDWVGIRLEFERRLRASKEFAHERESLQQALVRGDSSWRGSPLAKAARNARRNADRGPRMGTTAALQTLNPNRAGARRTG
jgi:hypothetical protein